MDEYVTKYQPARSRRIDAFYRLAWTAAALTATACNQH